MAVAWEDPPASAGGGVPVWAPLLAELRTRPGEWAKFGPYSSQSVYTMAREIRDGRRGGAQPAEFEAVGRRRDGAGFVFVRYVGRADLRAVTG